MNSSLRRGDTWDKPFSDFIYTGRLFTDSIDTNTFIHHSGQAASKIDYFICTKPLEEVCRSCSILDNSPSNTSSHLPIVFVTHVKLQIVHRKQKNSRILVSKYKWDKANLDEYQNEVETHITQWFHECSILESTFDIEEATKSLVNLLIEAADKAVPKKTVKFRGPRQPLPPHVLTSLVRKLLRNGMRKVNQLKVTTHTPRCKLMQQRGVTSTTSSLVIQEQGSFINCCQGNSNLHPLVRILLLQMVTNSLM